MVIISPLKIGLWDPFQMTMKMASTKLGFHNSMLGKKNPPLIHVFSAIFFEVYPMYTPCHSHFVHDWQKLAPTTRLSHHFSPFPRLVLCPRLKEHVFSIPGGTSELDSANLLVRLWGVGQSPFGEVFEPLDTFHE